MFSTGKNVRVRCFAVIFLTAVGFLAWMLLYFQHFQEPYSLTLVTLDPNRISSQRPGLDTRLNNSLISANRSTANGKKPAANGKKPDELCPENPMADLKDTKVPLNLTNTTYEELKRDFSHVIGLGGHYSPSACQARERLAIIIPYRNRQRNLHILLHNLIPFLVHQQAEFTLFLLEQTEDYLFNRCLLFNVGFVESVKYGNFTCFIIHDTDLIPRDYRNLYRCSNMPLHMVLSRSNEHWEEKLPYNAFIGGVLALRAVHMKKSNGCSNSYYGWGLEDDDLGIRLNTKGFRITRNKPEIGGYYSLGHAIQSTDIKARGILVKTIRDRMNKEGLNTLNYTLVQAQQLELYTWLLVRPPPPPPDIYTAT